MLQLVLYILLSPLVAFAIVIFFGKKLPRNGDWVSLFAVWTGLLASFYLLFTHVLGNFDPNTVANWQFEWLRWGSYTLVIGIALDNMAVVMLIVVTLVSALVHLFSVGYMKGDPKYHRFFAYLSFFTFSMLGLVLADNLLIIYAFWELVGLSSYLLIGFWYEKKSAADASKKAFITNRVGDAGMLIGILLVFTTLGTLNLSEVAQGVIDGKLAGGLLTFAGLALFCGAIGKSAQFPLHVWLPDAMEGPTPVSALIHAATMVAAGVYLVARLFVILTWDAALVIAYVGGFTALFAATIAVAQNDIKRVLAYSTVSQLGYMIMAMGVGSYMAGFFHLVTHAMFKACLFLGSGSVIYAMHEALHHVHSHKDAQDIRNMGGLKKYLPTTYLTFLIATISLAGVPLSSGFLSKDAILGGTLAFSMEHPQHSILLVFGFGAALLTAFYMFRLVYLTFFGEFRGGTDAEKHLKESPSVMTLPLVVLATLSVFLFYTLPSLNPFAATGGWFATLFETPARNYEPLFIMTEHREHLQHSAHIWAMVLSVLVAGTGIMISTMGYLWKKIDVEMWRQRLLPLHSGMLNKWWMDELYDATVIKGTLIWSNALSWFDGKVIDGIVNGTASIFRVFSKINGWFDNTVVDGLVNVTAWVIGFAGQFVRIFQGGQVQRYVLYSLVVIGLVILINVI